MVNYQSYAYFFFAIILNITITITLKNPSLLELVKTQAFFSGLCLILGDLNRQGHRYVVPALLPV